MSIHIDGKVNEISDRVIMPGDPLRAKYIAETFLENPKQYTNIRNMLGFTGTYKGVSVSIQGSGMGMPSMGIYSWELMKDYNVKKIIRTGTAGGFAKNLELGDIVMSISASTDSSFIKSYGLTNAYNPTASWNLLNIASKKADELNIRYKAGNTLTSDTFYETDETWWHKWAKMNVLAVEMEAAALYINAAYHNVEALSMMTISDHFVTKETFSNEERLYANDKMIKLALETIIE